MSEILDAVSEHFLVFMNFYPEFLILALGIQLQQMNQSKHERRATEAEIINKAVSLGGLPRHREESVFFNLFIYISKHNLTLGNFSVQVDSYDNMVLSFMMAKQNQPHVSETQIQKRGKVLMLAIEKNSS